MIKPTLLVKLLKQRLAAREAILAQDNSDLDIGGTYGELAQAEINASHMAIQSEIDFLKTLLKETASNIHEYSP